MAKRKYADINRQEVRLEPKGKFLKDEVTLEELGLNTGEYFLCVRSILFRKCCHQNLRMGQNQANLDISFYNEMLLWYQILKWIILLALLTFTVYGVDSWSLQNINYCKLALYMRAGHKENVMPHQQFSHTYILYN